MLGISQRNGLHARSRPLRANLLKQPLQQAKPLFWFSQRQQKSDTSKDVSLFICAPEKTQANGQCRLLRRDAPPLLSSRPDNRGFGQPGPA
ncbi:hypothetical protein BVIET440_340018 [Burkholderia vietnamiensis]